MNEVNFDGLVGPTHNYAGLAFGNTASINNAGIVANPKQAALQGLQKMYMLTQLGVPQAVMPPHARPNWGLLHSLGFSGEPMHMLEEAYKANPELLSVVYSAASMWTANMATVSPSSNTRDGRVHFTVANLTTNLHRAQEADFSYSLLQKIFFDEKYFCVHQPVAAYRDLADEGAANHSVLCQDYSLPGVELFVYGRDGLDANNKIKTIYPARQTKLSSLAITQKHLLNPEYVLFLQQNPLAIDHGAFHNDVVFVANKNVILCHEQALLGWAKAQTKLRNFFNDDCYFINISAKQLTLQQAVQTYLFNSQIISLSTGSMLLLAPLECENSVPVQEIIAAIIAADNPIKEVRYVDCRQSMLNGGGPACLRLRVILTAEQQASCLAQVFLTGELYKKLLAWINRHYRDRLAIEDLLDPYLYMEAEVALDELTKILNLGAIYPFQQI